MSERSMNLARAGDTDLIALATPGDGKASVSILASSWGTAVVELEWSAQDYDPNQIVDQEWLGFSPPVLFGSCLTQRRSIDISGSRALRLHVITADGTADSSAPIRAFTYRS